MRTFLVIGLWLFGVELPLIRGDCPNAASPRRIFIDDTDVEKEIYSIEVGEETLNSFKISQSGVLNETIASSYFTVHIEAKNLTLSTTKAFENVGIDADTNGAEQFFISMTVEIQDCPSLTLLVIIQSTFAKQPTFSENSYTYSLPMPIMPKSDFTVYGRKIAVSDTNFANTDMTMTTSSEDFDVSVVKIDNKHFEAVFSAKKFLRLTESQTFTLTATNSGSKQSHVDITINVDAANGLDEPLFDKSYYFFECSKDETGSLKPKDDDAIVVRSNKPNDAGYGLTGEFKDYFLTTFDNTSQLSLSLTKPLPSNVSGQIALTLSFTTDATGYTAIIVDVIAENIIPYFSTDHYFGKYDIITNQIDWTSRVEIKNATDVHLSDDVSELLKIDKNNYSILPITSLKKINFDENLNLVFTVTATSATKNEAQALVVLSFVIKELKFDKSYYSATYSEKDGNAVVKLDDGNDVGFSDVKDFTGIQIEVGKDYKNNFEIKLDNSQWTISVPKPLSEATLNENTKLMVPLTATWAAYEETASSVLILKLPEKSQVKFDKSYYTGSYVRKGDEDSVKLNEEIHLTGAKAGDISIKMEGFENNFNAIYNPETSMCEITIKSKLNSSIIKQDSQLIITIVALSTDLNLTSFATLILDLPMKTSSIEFEKAHYHATYNETDSTSPATVTVTDGPIKVDNKDGLDVQFSFEGFDDVFTATYDPKTSSCEITLQSNLNSSIIGHESQLTITIVALSSELNLKTYAILILDLPVKTSTIEFEKKHYHATYNGTDSTSKATVTVTDGPIKLGNKDGLEVQFSFEGFDDIFTATYIPESSSCEITLQSNLNSSIIGHESQLAITIVALSSELNLKTYAVLILDLPVKTSTIEFEKKHYHATYNDTDSTSKATVTVTDGPIKLGNKDGLEVQFSFEGFDDVFTATYDPKTSSCEITLRSNLNSSIIGHESQLTITIVALSSELNLKSYAVLILDLPVKTSTIEFEKKHYHATYNGTDSTSKATVTVIDGPIKLDNKDDLEVQFSFEGFDDIFTATYFPESSSCEITLQSNLNSSIIGHESQLTITIVALSNELNLKTYAVLILDLPVKTSTIEFEKKHYHATYNDTDSTSKATVTVTDGPIKLGNKDGLEVQFSFEGFDDVFTATYDPKTSSCEITLRSNLNSSIIGHESQLTITIVALSSELNLKSYAVLILDLPVKTSTIEFEKKHYHATYNGTDSTSKATVTVIDGPIKLDNKDDLEVQFSFEGFDDIFTATYFPESSSCEITLQSNLNSSIIGHESQLTITIVALSNELNLKTYAVLILDLPVKTSTIEFEKKHYHATYNDTDSTSKATVTVTDGPIKLGNKDGLEVQFSFEGFDDVFTATYDPKTSSCEITLRSNLNSSIIGHESQLTITIVALSSELNLKSYAVLILDLPVKTSTIEFEKKHYHATYNGTDSTSKATVTVIDGPIKLDNKDGLEVQFSFEGFDDEFTATYDPKTSSCEITLQSNLNSSIIGHESQLTITIVALSSELNLKTYAVLILDLPVKTSTIEFEKKHYHATYNDTDSTSKATVTVTDGPIKLDNKDGLEVQVSFEGFDDVFTATFDPKTSSYGIALQRNLNSSIIGHESQLTITIVALSTEPNLKTYAVLILDLPVKTSTIEFEKKHYHATYNETDSTSRPIVTLTEGPIKIINNDHLDLKPSLEGYEDNFHVTYDPRTSTCEITVQANLDPKVIEENSQLILTLTATSDDKKLTSYTIIVLDLPSKTQSIEFEKKHYHARYNDTDSTSKATVTVIDGPIKLDNKDGLEVQFSFEGFDDIFSATYIPESSSCEITLQSNLNSSIIGHKSQLTITIVALSNELNLKTYAVLILDLPVKTSTIEFEKKHYHATYNDTDSTSKATVTVTDGPIKLDNKDGLEVQVSFEGFDDVFTATYDPKTSSYGIALQRDLNSSIIGHESQLTITIVALSTEPNLKTYAVLILDLPVKTSTIEFEKKHYHATYNETDSTSRPIVTLTEGPIKIINNDHLDLKPSLEGYEDNFRVTYDPKTSTCEITVQANLDPKVVEENSQLILTLTATSDDKKLTTYTIIVLDLPSKTQSIQFEKKHYSAIYELDSHSVATVNIEDGPVKILNENNVKLNFSFEDFEDNFEMIYDATSLTFGIKVKSNLDLTSLADKTQLIITITAHSADNNLACYTALILALPKSDLSVEFEKKHYYAKYELGVDSKPKITVVDGPIKISNEKGLDLQFAYEGYEDNLALRYSTETGTYELEVKNKFNDSVFESQTPLIISIVASTKEASNLGYTVLTLVSSQEPNSISFAEEYYVAYYQTDPELKVSLPQQIVLEAKNESNMKFSFEGYDDHFKVEYVRSTKSCNIKTGSVLNDTVLSTKSELLIILTAEDLDSHNTASTVIVLKLPSYVNDVFESSYYSAEYKLKPDSDTDEISMTDMNIRIKSDEYTAISFKGYEDNFIGSCNKTTLECTVAVQKNLNSTTLSSSEELVVTIVASSELQPVPAKTLLVLKLPHKNSTFAFSKEYYKAVYSIEKLDGETATVHLEGLVSLIGAGSGGVSIVLDAYSDYFELSLDSTTWNLKVKKNLVPEILSNKTELVTSLTATQKSESDPDYAKATLIIKLPDKTTVRFSRSQYYGEYLVDDSGGVEILLDADSEIATTDIDNTKIELNNFRDLFLITLSGDSKWSISLHNSLNASILSLYTELRLQMTLTKIGVSYGEAGLTIRLPPLSFSKDTYSGSYSIDENGGGKVDVEEISLGDIDDSYIELKLTNYTEYFKLARKSTIWDLEVANKLPEDILNTKSELVLTLTATKRNQTGSDQAKATVLIKLPDDTRIAFTKPQYYAKYVIKYPSPVVVIEDDSEIAITDSVNSKIVLDSFASNFHISLNSQSKWIMNVGKPLNSSILTEYSELRLLLTITKLGISYGEAGLHLKLPSLKFSQDKYSGLYSFVDSDVGSIIVDNITIDNVDASYIKLNLMEYKDNFYVEESQGKWSIKVKKPLSADITDKQLVTNLQVIRLSDNTILATTVVVISLPTVNPADAPVFSAITFNGDYINSDPPVVKMEKLISLVHADSDPLPIVSINESNQFSTNFSLVQEKDNQYSVKVEGRLGPEVLDEQTNIALTLMAKSTEGTYGYATLVISLPKAVRNTSVQVENHEILFNGTYKKGVFTSPKIPLVTNSTNEEDILVKMTNDLGIDSNYFSYTYSDGILSVHVGEIPDDVLKNTPLIPLKLAITDKNTQDTIYAVLNVEISSDDGGHGGGGTDDGSANGNGSDHIGLIVAVSVLAALLVLVLVFVSYFWFFRLRANKYVEMKEEEEVQTKPHLFTKNLARTSTPSLPPPRRPTGISVGLTDTLNEESSSDQDVPVSISPDPSIHEKKVAFNEVVEKIDETVGGDEPVEAPDNLLSVADRRPTQFVFAYPLETGVLDVPDDSEESSDFQVKESSENPREKKKSVIFNEYIERMDIEPLEDNDDENEGGENATENSTENDEPKIFKSTSELQIKNEEQLPSEIFKEIF